MNRSVSDSSRFRPAVAMVVLLVLLVLPGLALAHVLDPKADRDLSQLRATLAKRAATHAACLAKAQAACEAKGALSSPECDVRTGSVSYEAPAGAQTARFQAALAKCDAKLNLPTKSLDYEGIACPGDCDADADGVQPCASLAAYLAVVAAQAREEVAERAGAVDAACADTGEPSSAARLRCVRDVGKQLAAYRSSLATCQLKCETDAKGKKGGGASTNSGVCLVSAGDPAFTACADKAAAKLKHAASAALAPVVTATLDALTDDLFNRADPTDPDTGTLQVCGSCGDGVREGSEACDGDDLGGCGACTTACACAIDPVLDGPAGSSCTTDFNVESADYQPLCVPSAGSARHIRLEGVHSLANNGYAYLAMGFPDSPSGNPSTGEGDGRFIFTAGKSVSCGTGWSYFRYSGITDPATSGLCAAPVYGEYNQGPRTVCLDISADSPPRVTFWASGASGANCHDAATLTVDTALYSIEDWGSATNEAVTSGVHFLKVNSAALATMTRAAVSSSTVLP